MVYSGRDNFLGDLMRNRNVSIDQFASIPEAVMGAADTVATETGSARTYPPYAEGSNEWYVEETSPRASLDEEYRGMGMQMARDYEGPVERLAMPEAMDVSWTDRRSDQLPHQAGAGWGETRYSQNWNAMADPATGRGAARDRFGYDSPEWRRRNMRVVK